MVSKWVITPIYPIYKWVITHVLTIDPNFQRDIQVVSRAMIFLPSRIISSRYSRLLESAVFFPAKFDLFRRRLDPSGVLRFPVGSNGVFVATGAQLDGSRS